MILVTFHHVDLILNRVIMANAHVYLNFSAILIQFKAVNLSVFSQTTVQEIWLVSEINVLIPVQASAA